MTRDLLALDDLSPDLLLSLAQRAEVLAQAWTDRQMPQSLSGKRIGLIVDDSGWRNTSALDLGIQVMGGHCVKLPISFAGGETLEDLSAYLNNWVDLVAVRTPLLRRLRAFAEAAPFPVMNLRTKVNHPCETLGDLSYLHAQRGSLDGLTVVAVAPIGNILQSWVEAARVLPIRLVQLYDTNYLMKEDEATGGSIETTDSMSAIREADVVITDCWPKNTNDALLRRYQVTVAHLDTIRPGGHFIPCPPVSRSREVSADAMLHPTFAATAAKAYLMHAQNAYLEWALNNA